MEKVLFTLKDPGMGLEIDGVRYGANQLTKKKVLELINRNANYGSISICQRLKSQRRN